MNLIQYILTFLGAFLFPVALLTVSEYLIKRWGVLGGFYHASIVIGTFWIVNHGLGLIHQSGPLWVDMAFAAFFGLMIHSKYQNYSLLKSLLNFASAILGAILASLLIVFLG
jgi:hypothetical protein